jgi:PAS domain-containing protein
VSDPGLANPYVQETLLGEACAAAEVGVLVWDDDRRYIAVNARACEILGCTLEQILGAVVGERTVGSRDVVEDVLRGEGGRGRLTVERFDGGGAVEIEYVTFATRAAGLPYMASVIWPAGER